MWRMEEEEASRKKSKEQEHNWLPKEESEKVHDKELTGEIEELIVIQDKEVEPDPFNQDFDLMLSTQ